MLCDILHDEIKNQIFCHLLKNHGYAIKSFMIPQKPDINFIIIFNFTSISLQY